MCDKPGVELMSIGVLKPVFASLQLLLPLCCSPCLFAFCLLRVTSVKQGRGVP